MGRPPDPTAPQINLRKADSMVKLFTKRELLVKYYPNVYFDDKIRTQAPKKYRHYGLCVKCGLNQAQDAHHINQNWKDNRKKNVMLVCKPCHRLIHKQEPKVIPLYKVKKLPNFQRPGFHYKATRIKVVPLVGSNAPSSLIL